MTDDTHTTHTDDNGPRPPRWLGWYHEDGQPGFVGVVSTLGRLFWVATNGDRMALAPAPEGVVVDREISSKVGQLMSSLAKLPRPTTLEVTGRAVQAWGKGLGRGREPVHGRLDGPKGPVVLNRRLLTHLTDGSRTGLGPDARWEVRVRGPEDPVCLRGPDDRVIVVMPLRFDAAKLDTVPALIPAPEAAPVAAPEYPDSMPLQPGEPGYTAPEPAPKASKAAPTAPETIVLAGGSTIVMPAPAPAAKALEPAPVAPPAPKVRRSRARRAAPKAAPVANAAPARPELTARPYWRELGTPCGCGLCARTARAA